MIESMVVEDYVDDTMRFVLENVRRNVGPGSHWARFYVNGPGMNLHHFEDVRRILVSEGFEVTYIPDSSELVFEVRWGTKGRDK